jgi:hypothetical protein
MRPMSRILVLLLAFAATTGTAYAGGWATVELGAPPGGLVAGEPWRVELIVKQHGVTPLDGVEPRVEITDEAGAARTFHAHPTGRPGTYVTEVTYPTAGTWNTRLYDGFTDAYPHRLAPLTVAPGSGAAAASGDDFPWAQAVMIAIVALLFGGGIAATSDRPRLHIGTVGLRGRAA